MNWRWWYCRSDDKACACKFYSSGLQIQIPDQHPNIWGLILIQPICLESVPYPGMSDASWRILGSLMPGEIKKKKGYFSASGIQVPSDYSLLVKAELKPMLPDVLNTYFCWEKKAPDKETRTYPGHSYSPGIRSTKVLVLFWILLSNSS